MNELHQFLHDGNVQARPVIGDTFDFGSQTGLTGFFSAADDKTTLELCGSLEELDQVGVVDVDQFDVGNEPMVNDLFSFNGVQFIIRGKKTDQSAYVLGLKMIDPGAGINPARFQRFNVPLVEGEESKVVTFPVPFAEAPATVYVSLNTPEGGYVFVVAVEGDPTAEGCLVSLGAAVPGAGYSLTVIAIL